MSEPAFPPLTRQERLRRAIILCCAALRNFAYYRAGWEGEERFFTGQLQATVNSNFLDIGVIDWCKLFGKDNEKHHWRQIVKDDDKQLAFNRSLHSCLKCDPTQWEELRNGMLAYRDKFLSHLDNQRGMLIPKLELPITTALFYHQFLMINENDGRTYGTLPCDARAYYEQCHAEGLKFYRR